MIETMPVAEPQAFPFSNCLTVSAASTHLGSPNIWISGPSPSLLLLVPFSLCTTTSMKDLPAQCLDSKHPSSSVPALPPYLSQLCGKQSGILRSIPVPETWFRSNPWSKQGQLLCAHGCSPSCSHSQGFIQDGICFSPFHGFPWHAHNCPGSGGSSIIKYTKVHYTQTWISNI